MFLKFLPTEKVLPKKRAFDYRDFKKNTFRSKNFSLFQTYNFSLEKGKIFCGYFPETLKEFLQPRFFANTMLN
jgi:hypothetical protein